MWRQSTASLFVRVRLSPQSPVASATIKSIMAGGDADMRGLEGASLDWNEEVELAEERLRALAVRDANSNYLTANKGKSGKTKKQARKTRTRIFSASVNSSGANLPKAKDSAKKDKTSPIQSITPTERTNNASLAEPKAKGITKKDKMSPIQNAALTESASNASLAEPKAKPKLRKSNSVAVGLADVKPTKVCLTNEQKRFIDDHLGHVSTPNDTDGASALPVTVYRDRLRRERRLLEARDKVLTKGLVPRKPKRPPSARSETRADKSLPVFANRKEIVNAVRKNQVVVICGDTGCGKSTQVPQMLLDEFASRSASGHKKQRDCRVVVAQPRRLAATALASRVAFERGEAQVGISVGYQVRFEKQLPKRRDKSIVFMTLGTILSRMICQPTLPFVTHLVVDEVHERTVENDILLALLKESLRSRPNLKIILMSATINVEAFSEYFFSCPIVRIKGRMFPVEEFYLEDILQQVKGSYRINFNTDHILDELDPAARKEAAKLMPIVAEDLKERGYSEYIVGQLSKTRSEELNLTLVASVIGHIHKSEPLDGSVLVFVPGWDAIEILVKFLTDPVRSKHSLKNALVLPLHSQVSFQRQADVFKKPPPGVRKIVVSTNVAETSITIDDVAYVIDCGKAKMLGFNLSANISTFAPQWISAANAKQRMGRAGRTKPGKCYKLYTRMRSAEFEPFLAPDICRTSLEEAVMRLKASEVKDLLKTFNTFLNPPSEKAVHLAVNKLIVMQLLTGSNATDAKLSPLGLQSTFLPLEPHSAKMALIAAMCGCLDPVLSVAAVASTRDPFNIVPFYLQSEFTRKKMELAGTGQSDQLLYHRLVQKWEALEDQPDQQRDFCEEYFASGIALRVISDIRKQLAERLYDAGFLETPEPGDIDANLNSDDDRVVMAVVGAGLFPKVGRIHSSMSESPAVVTPQFNKRASKLSKRSAVAVNKVASANDLFAYGDHVLGLRGCSVSNCTLMSPLLLPIFGKLSDSQDKISMSVDGAVCPWNLDQTMLNVKFSSGSSNRLAVVKHVFESLITKCMIDPSDWREEDQERLEAILDVFRW